LRLLQSTSSDRANEEEFPLWDEQKSWTLHIREPAHFGGWSHQPELMSESFLRVRSEINLTAVNFNDDMGKKNGAPEKAPE
jgi:hypothetical protein